MKIVHIAPDGHERNRFVKKKKMSINQGQMEFNFSESIEPTPCGPSEVNPFDVRVLLASIHNTDDLVRKHNAKCDENKQLQANLTSLKDSSDKIRELYAVEKSKNAKLVLDQRKVADDNKRLKAIQHEQINNETIQKQTIAELECRLETMAKEKNAKYVNLCESFVAQALILHTNGLSTPTLTKKSVHAREILKAHNRPFEWTESRSASKTMRSPIKATAKCKCNSTASPTKDAAISFQPKRVMTSEKGTMVTQTTATRSTCTSAFIRTVDASTNTPPANESETELCSIVRQILDEMVPLPPFQSPIHEIVPIACAASAACSNGSTQTDTKKYRNQGTVTTIQNVRKRVHYIRNDSDPHQSSFVDSLRCIKKEDIASPFGSMSNLLMAQQMGPEIPFNGYRGQQFLHLWIMLGQLLFPMADQSIGYQKQDPKLMEKLQQVQKLLGGQPLDSSFGGLMNDIEEPCIDLMTDSGDENLPTTSLIKESVSDCSQDSIRSNENYRVTESEVRVFGTLSAFVDDNSVDTSHETVLPAPVPIPTCQVNRPILQETSDAQTNCNIEQGDKNQQFKVPKRKLLGSTAEENKNKRKRKTEKKVIVGKSFKCFRLDINLFVLNISRQNILE